jgi:hypothetical protein
VLINKGKSTMWPSQPTFWPPVLCGSSLPALLLPPPAPSVAGPPPPTAADTAACRGLGVDTCAAGQSATAQRHDTVTQARTHVLSEQCCRALMGLQLASLQWWKLGRRQVLLQGYRCKGPRAPPSTLDWNCCCAALYLALTAAVCPCCCTKRLCVLPPPP